MTDTGALTAEQRAAELWHSEPDTVFTYNWAIKKIAAAIVAAEARGFAAGRAAGWDDRGKADVAVCRDEVRKHAADPRRRQINGVDVEARVHEARELADAIAALPRQGPQAWILPKARLHLGRDFTWE